MSNTFPEQESPVTLRAARELGARPAQKASATVAEASAQATASFPEATQPSDRPGQAVKDGDGAQATLALTVTAVAAIASVGWILGRRQRTAQPSAMGTISRIAEESLEVGAPVAPPRLKFAVLLGVPGKKQLIKVLFWGRSIAGASAIVAAIAIVVFWAIEFTDVGAGETGLNVPLLAGVVAGWTAYWGCGRLANMLYRSVFNRNHPKFTD